MVWGPSNLATSGDHEPAVDRAGNPIVVATQPTLSGDMQGRVRVTMDLCSPIPSKNALGHRQLRGFTLTGITNMSGFPSGDPRACQSRFVGTPQHGVRDVRRHPFATGYGLDCAMLTGGLVPSSH
jgi:hypothetical protein